jgi:SAM-dependent methyltransferase
MCPNLTSRICPVCQGTVGKVFYRMAEFYYLRCNSCKMLYVGNPSSDTSSSFSQPLLKRTQPHVRHLQCLNILRDSFASKQTIDIAEIGVGYGDLAMLLLKDGRYNYIGYELSKERSDYCRSLGLHVLNESFQSNKKFDVVILDNVLEHVSDPRLLLHDAILSLKAGGFVVLIVPNRYDLRRFVSSWRRVHYWQPACHINMFCYSALRRLTNYAGAELRPFGVSSLRGVKTKGVYLKTTLDYFGCFVGGLYFTIHSKPKI